MDKKHFEYHTVYGDEGPVVVLVAGQHGNETTGIELARALVFAYKMAGPQTFRLAVFHAANVWGVVHGEHCDQLGRNPNCFWEVDGGILPCAAELWGVLRSPDCAGLIDLHDGAAFCGGYLYFQEGDEAAAKRLFRRVASEACTAEWLSRTIAGCARSIGLSAFTVEAVGREPLGRLPKIVFEACRLLASDHGQKVQP